MSTLITIPTPGTLTVEGWTNQYLTMSELKDLIRLTMRSPETEAAFERDRWSNTEIYTAIQRACMRVAPLIKVREAFTFAFTNWERDYQLPAYVETVLSVRVRAWQQAIVVEDGTEQSLGWTTINDWRYMPGIQGNILHFNRLYGDLTDAEVTFLRPMQVPPIPVSLGGNIDGDDTEVLVAVPSAFPVPGMVKLDDEVIWYGELSSGGLTSTYRALFSTLAAAHTTADVVDPIIPVEQGKGLIALQMAAEVELLNMRLNDAGNADTSRTLAQLQAKQQDLLRLERQLVGSHPPGTLSNLHDYRPRRKRWVV